MSKISCLINFTTKRCISLTAVRDGKRNFRKFVIANKRGSILHKKREAKSPELEIDKRGVRDTGYVQNGQFVLVPEMIPEIIVPDLEGFTLKPYVSYKAQEITQSEFTAQQLFDAVYSRKIVTDFKAGKLDDDYQPMEPSEEEKLTPEEAVARAKKTGSDIF